jgi:RNA polymerase sigma-70 factor (ECF subfamily)
MPTTDLVRASPAHSHAISPSDFQILSYEALVEARRLVRSLPLPQHDLEDVRHELLVDLLRRLRSFLPNRGTLGAFAGKIVKHRAARIASRIRRERRVFESLEAYMLEAGDDCASFASRDLHRSAILVEIEDRLDLRHALRGLERTELQLCSALIEATPTEIARSPGRSRAGVYRAIGKIRRHMISNGITAAA